LLVVEVVVEKHLTVVAVVQEDIEKQNLQ